MIRKSGNRFSEKCMIYPKASMIPKSGNRLSDEIMLNQKSGRRSDSIDSDYGLAAKPAVRYLIDIRWPTKAREHKR